MEQLQKDFFEFRQTQILLIKAQAEALKKDKNARVYETYLDKYPFLKRKNYPTIREMLAWKETQEKFNYENQTKPLLDKFIGKITGIFKHGQTDKTRLCNMRIIENIRAGKLTIAISKNLLSSKIQWEQRLIDSLKESFPDVELKDLILVISSKVNNLNGNATHCKLGIQASNLITLPGSKFKIIFVCSNKERVENVINILEHYNELREERRSPIDIIHDEAHNREEGIPSKREYIEHILMYPSVVSYVPVSASPDPIFIEDEHDILWQKSNLEMNALDYTSISNVVSSSDNYSSIADAKQITFDDFMRNILYKDYNVTEFEEDIFNEADLPNYYADTFKWDSEEKIKADKDRRRQLEFCIFMAYEKKAVNIGRNLLDNFYRYKYTEGDITIETPIILSGVFNLHIITTPCRVALTIDLMEHALKQDYNPICIGLYRSQIHIRYKDNMGQIIKKKHCDLDIETQSQEMNNKIHEILDHLKEIGESVDRPFIIMGNYKPTGESITFVNYKYGTIRSDTLLPVLGQTREKSYQGFLRCCYMDTRFKLNNPNFEHPLKWIIGSTKSIKDALEYEEENDRRVANLPATARAQLIPRALPAQYPENKNRGLSIPCKIAVIDHEYPSYQTLREIFNQPTRSNEDKKQILTILRRMKETDKLILQDPTGKFDFHTFTLKDVRTYKKFSEEQELQRRQEKLAKKKKYTPHQADWRFREYDSHFKNKESYMNNKTKMEPMECELYMAYDRYEYEGCENPTGVMWLSYRFE